MSALIINDSEAKLSKEAGKFVVSCYGEVLQSLPIETVDEVVILGSAMVTTPCIKECLKRGRMFKKRNNNILLFSMRIL